MIIDYFLNLFPHQALLPARQYPFWRDCITTIYCQCYGNTVTYFSLKSRIMQSILCKKLALNSFFYPSSSRLHVEDVLMNCSKFLCHLSRKFVLIFEPKIGSDIGTSSLTLKNENDCFLSAHLSSSLIITWNSWLIKGCFTRKSFFGFRPINILVAFRKLAQFSNAILL